MTASLDDLADAADRIDTDATAVEGLAPGAELPPPEPTVDDRNLQAIGFMLAAFRELACSILKVESLRRTLADRECETCARVLAPVATKWGVDLGGYLAGPEGVALMTAGPILYRAYSELNDELRARRATRVEPEPVADVPQA